MNEAIATIEKRYPALDADTLRRALVDFTIELDHNSDGRYGKLSKEQNRAVGRIGCKHCGGTVRGQISKYCPNCGYELL